MKKLKDTSDAKELSINQMTPKSSISVYCKDLLSQLSSSVDSVSTNNSKTVWFHGIEISESHYTSCIPQLTEFIKSQTNPNAQECTSQNESCAKKSNTNEDILDFFPSPSQFHDEIYLFDDSIFEDTNDKQNDGALECGSMPAEEECKDIENIVASTPNCKKQKEENEDIDTNLSDRNMLIFLSNNNIEHDLSDYLLNMSVNDECGKGNSVAVNDSHEKVTFINDGGQKPGSSIANNDGPKKIDSTINHINDKCEKISTAFDMGDKFEKVSTTMNINDECEEVSTTMNINDECEEVSTTIDIINKCKKVSNAIDMNDKCENISTAIHMNDKCELLSADNISDKNEKISTIIDINDKCEKVFTHFYSEKCDKISTAIYINDECEKISTYVDINNKNKCINAIQSHSDFDLCNNLGEEHTKALLIAKHPENVDSLPPKSQKYHEDEIYDEICRNYGNDHFIIVDQVDSSIEDEDERKKPSISPNIEKQLMSELLTLDQNKQTEGSEISLTELEQRLINELEEEIQCSADSRSSEIIELTDDKLEEIKDNSNIIYKKLKIETNREISSEIDFEHTKDEHNNENRCSKLKSENENVAETPADAVELKSYQKPFTSSNENENKDINDPKWEVFRKLETDKDRYLTVRKLWKSTTVPDPNANLTVHSYRRKQMLIKAEKKEETPIPESKVAGARSNKREREGDDCNLPNSKRARMFKNLRFNEEAIERTINTLLSDYNCEISNPSLSYNHIKKIEHRFQEYLTQLANSRKEAEIIHKFYTGLPNQKVLTQMEIEQEQWDIEQVYNLFKRFYKWSGKVFNPVVG